MTVQTKAVHFSADKKLLQFIQRKLKKLERLFDRIIGVEVVMKLENAGKVKDKVVEVYLKVPGNTIIIKETQKTFEKAIDLTVPVLKRKLKQHKEKIRMKAA